MQAMNKMLCTETRKRGTFTRTMCLFCAYSEKCTDLQEHRNKYDERRDMAKEVLTRTEDFTNPYELY